ncbi:hypothetical protein VG1_CDS0029 [Arthrobacter phage Cupello]|nr:hypothetical protein VG1_CDS0029 [Arthrobacter phage Cupello]
MLDILLAVLALGGLAAIARQLLPLLVARQTYRRTQDAAQEAHEEWKRRQAERNRKRVDRQAELAEWTGTFNALLLENRLRQSRPAEPRPEPEGEPIAVIRAWDGTIVGKVWDQPPPVPTNSDPFDTLTDAQAQTLRSHAELVARRAADIQRQRNWTP